jgi:hypothetical protein
VTRHESNATVRASVVRRSRAAVSKLKSGCESTRDDDAALKH